MYFPTALSTLLLASLATGQEPAPSQDPAPRTQRTSAPQTGPVDRVLLLFAGADADDDRKIAPAEAQKAGIRGADFATYDYNADRSWEPDEFLLYYRGLLQRAGHKVAPELDQAVEKVLDARKAAERAREARAQAAAEARAAADESAQQGTYL